MKNLLYILLLIPFGILAQTPQGFKYQAVIRNANGSLVTNQQVSIKTSLISGSALGNVDYSEQHDVATNGYGVASFIVGGGTPITGSYAAVNWSGNDYFLKTELDIQNNGNFQLMGTSQILSVPYASHANTATSSLVDNDTSATNEIQQLSLQGNQLILSGGGSVTLTGTVDLDPDPSNELQTLSLSNDTLYLTNGNYVVLPPDSDADTTNEIQTLANTAGTISISGSNTITLADSSATNELQTLSQTAGSISISNGNTITILDSSATNELQSLTVIGQDSLMITNGNTIKIPSLDNSETNEIQILSNTSGTISLSSANTIVLADSSANNEIQMLSNTAGTISISSANTIVLEDSSSTNEIQNLSIIGDSLSISDGNSVNIPNEIPSGTIVWSESSNDTALINKNFKLYGVELKNVAIESGIISSNDTNEILIINDEANFTNQNISPNNSVYNQEVSFIKNNIFYLFSTNSSHYAVHLEDSSISNPPTGTYKQFKKFLWNGTDLYSFGGKTGSGYGTQMHNTFEKFNFATNTWISLSTSGAPSPRCDVSMVWTDDKLIVYGGMTISGYYSKAYKISDGGIYDPNSNSWSSIPSPPSNIFQPSNRHTIVWTGSEMIVWGGYTSSGSSNFFTGQQNQGAKYNPSSNNWNSISTPPSSFVGRGMSNYAWTGSEMIVWAGRVDGNNYNSWTTDGCIYNPTSDIWRVMATPSSFEHTDGYVFDGKRLILCGNSRGGYIKQLLVYDYEENFWSDFSNSINSPYEGHTSLFTLGHEKTYVLDMSSKLKSIEFKNTIGVKINTNNTFSKWYFMYRKK